MERNPRAKVSPFFSFTGICVMPRNWYSTGIFNGDDLVFVGLDFVDGGVQRGRFARTRRPGHQHHAVRLANIAAETAHFFGGETHDIQAEALEFLATAFLCREHEARRLRRGSPA